MAANSKPVLARFNLEVRSVHTVIVQGFRCNKRHATFRGEKPRERGSKNYRCFWRTPPRDPANLLLALRAHEHQVVMAPVSGSVNGLLHIELLIEEYSDRIFAERVRIHDMFTGS